MSSGMSEQSVRNEYYDLGFEDGMKAAEAASPAALDVIREVRGRLYEAAWRREDGTEWLDPKVVSRILDDLAARLTEQEDR